jgi:hypothetical protein
MRLLYLKKVIQHLEFTIQEWKQSKDKTETDEWFLIIIKGRMALYYFNIPKILVGGILKLCLNLVLL